ncbi:hypothetical protein [Streptomyces capitiformicae]|uniref:Uncharacterized protein n=1 Tax=Streptomyces capitiformicae TaxID=2014920 RepID=A0A918ZL76_9ACTN|nr:hypothetical protein [Streptomyces capitiformicae]GHE57146.1 hypothetical protein GCM10017771_79860 [Streptomyces capitiformicae]
MAASGGGSGLFSMAWGIWATGFGWIIASDFRGAAHRFYELSQRSVPFSARRAPLVGVGFLRILAGVFALIGPAVLVGGLLELVRGEGASDRLPQLPVPLAATVVLVGAFGLWTAWRPSGLLRREWAEGADLQRAAVAVVTAALVGFPATLALGHQTAMLASWLGGGLAGLVLLLSGRFIFAEQVQAEGFARLPGLRDLVLDPAGTTLRGQLTGELDALVKAAARHHVTALRVTEPALDDLFHAYYTDAEAAPCPTAAV